MKKIELTKGQFAIIDDEDFDLISKYQWFALSARKKFYAQTNLKRKGKKRPTLKMHRLILGAKDGEFVDHINHNTLDNRRCNLRIVTQIENAKNYTLCKSNTSGFLGVEYYRKNGSWRSVIRHEGMRIFLGYYKNKEDAIKARKEAEVKYGYHQNHGKNIETENFDCEISKKRFLAKGATKEKYIVKYKNMYRVIVSHDGKRKRHGSFRDIADAIIMRDLVLIGKGK